jgi:NAD(P)H-hydrate repair Nnr-like enzyme with NAD(P)H-hydrate dehydratase domain
VGGETHGRDLASLGIGRTTLLDTDTITYFQGDPRSLDHAIAVACAMEGEFRRVSKASGDELMRTSATARRNGAVIVLKGSDMVIAVSGGRRTINTNAPSTVVTAGSGDVLSGIVLARATATTIGPGLPAEA